jgi:hypothetical protein
VRLSVSSPTVAGTTVGFAVFSTVNLLISDVILGGLFRTSSY